MTEWKGKWVGPAYDPRQDLGVFAFRNAVELSSVPSSLPVRVSADNRYKLYVNGEMVAFGPQRGDERHWFYDHFDLAPYLRAGKNEIVALVWNFGWMAPMAQHTVRTALVFDALGLDTPGNWEVARIDGWGFDMMHSSIGQFYIDIGPGEIIGPNLLPNTQNPTPNTFTVPHVIADAEDRAYGGGGTPWMLIPRSIPPMRYETRSMRPVARHGFNGDSGSALSEGDVFDGSVALAAGSKILLDYGELLCAYPRLVLSGPEGSEVTLTYAEALWQTDGNKGNRNEVVGKEMRGYQDQLILGTEPSTYEPLWWRTYRYLLVEVADESPTPNPLPQRLPIRSAHFPAAGSSKTTLRDGTPVTLHSFDAIETGYPLKVESSFEADDPSVKPLWDVSVRTAQRCAGETYFDCPYYEQLQYAGDTRIQALIGYYAGRDRRLQRNAIENLGWSLMDNGLTQSRYPSRQTQVIPPFSLWWVMMLYDQLLYDEVTLVEADGGRGWHPRQTVPNIVSLAFEQLGEKDGHFWNFGDWVPDWRSGVPPGDLLSTMHTLTYSMAHLIAHKFIRPIDPEKRVDFEKYEWDNFVYDIDRTSTLVRLQEDPDWHASEHSEAIYRVAQLMTGREPAPWPTEDLAGANWSGPHLLDTKRPLPRS